MNYERRAINRKQSDGKNKKAIDSTKIKKEEEIPDGTDNHNPKTSVNNKCLYSVTKGGW